ncbi:MAG TPA: T9SS type A sorting domain-containing protein [Candidatus Kapabacteria bacterium]
MKCITLILAILLFTSALAYGQAGYLDKTFGDGGVVKVAYSNGKQIYPLDIIALDSGKFMHTGWMIDPAKGVNAYIYIYVMKHLSDGRIDSSFGDHGYRLFGPAYSLTKARLFLCPDGGVLVYGDRWCDSIRLLKPSIVRFTVDGNIDSSFGDNGGYLNIYTPDEGYFEDLKVNADGSILAVGAEQSSDNTGAYYVPTITRITSSGKNDVSFGDNGRKTIDSENKSGYMYGAILYKDQKVIFGCSPLLQTSPLQMVMTDSDGNIDSSQWGGGRLREKLSDARDFVLALKESAEGAIVCAVGIATNDRTISVVTRFLSNGEIDESFGNFGIPLLPYDNYLPYLYLINIDSNKNTLHAGFIDDSSGRFSVIMRYNEDGKLDSLYDGSRMNAGLSKYVSQINSIAVQSDGKYLVAGSNNTRNGGWWYAVFCRLNNKPTLNVPSNTIFSNPITVHPTPSTDNCTVTYTLTASSQCTITLRDESGREVRTFAQDEYRTSGEHKEELDLRGLASGVYFLQIESNGSIQTAKLIKQ